MHAMADEFQHLEDYTFVRWLRRAYLALNNTTGALVNIEELSPKVSQHQNHYEKLKPLGHPNIVRYIELLVSHQRTYLITEHVDDTLYTLVCRVHKLPELLVMHFTKQLLSALRAIHALDIVHCDLKCANALVASKGVIKLTAFNISIDLSSNTENTARGSPYWMAPEVIQMHQFSTAADIWSLGCTVIEMLRGSPPLSEFPLMAAMFRRAEDTTVDIPVEASPLLSSFLSHCFEPNVSERWSAIELSNHPFVRGSLVDLCCIETATRLYSNELRTILPEDVFDKCQCIAQTLGTTT